MDNWKLSEDRCFDIDRQTRSLARMLYTTVKDLPIISPHGHVDPALLGDPDAAFGSPVDLFVIPDHYVFRMLYSQGVSLDQLGIPRKDGSPAEQNHRRIWQIFCENFYLFRGTPTGLWLTDEMINVFGITIKPDGDNAQRIYDMLSERLASPEYKPRSLFSRFNIQVLCTTDPASSNLAWHRSLYNDGWAGKIRPTFRPDAVTNLLASGWRKSIDDLSSVSRIDINRYSTFIHALEQRRVFFRENGAVASDHSAIQPMTINLPEHHVEAIFQRALKGEADFNDAALFTGHMLVEMARMSVEDGLVMQLHAGPFRNHNALIYGQFGLDKGADIPVACDFTRGLAPLLDLFGNDSRLTLILFSLDESAYSRELAPLAGHYPTIKLGPPWWFHDSFNGMRRYLDQVVETAGLYNLAGFNDDTRAFPSIPARHDLWRRVTSNWLAGMVLRGFIDQNEASLMAVDCAYNLAKKTYRL